MRALEVMSDRKAERHFVHIMPSFAQGGISIRLAYLINHIDLPIRHTIISLDRNFGTMTRIRPDLPVTTLEPPKAGGLLSRLAAYRQLIHDLKPDVLQTFQWGSIEWALANRFKSLVPHIHLESGFGVEEADRQVPRRVWMRRLALGHIETLIVPSQTLVTIARTDWKIPDRKITYIPNGVDCEKYAGQPVPGFLPGFTKRPNEKIVGTLTPLRPEKNLSRLIRAFAKATAAPELQNTRLLIMGEGMERPKLEALAASLNITDRVVLAGHVDGPEKALGWLDLYAISSDTEQMPNSVNQAMAAGKAVAGLDVGDVKHIVSPQNKPLIVAKGDDDAFAMSIQDLLLNDDKRHQIGAANAAHVRATYALDGMVESYKQIWRRL